MAILVQGPHGLIHADSREFENKLRYGDGVSWSGDPRLQLRVRVARRSTAGGAQTGQRYEVWRECEDGELRIIGHWRIEERDKILLDLAVMKAAIDRPNTVDSVTDVIDASNAAKEKAVEDNFVARNFDGMEHYVRLINDTTGPRTSHFGVGATLPEPKTP
jgi:hypothetical protein